jgi:hypothetical protein
MMRNVVESNPSFPKHPFNSPYPLRETLGWLWRNAVGPNRKNEGNVEFTPRISILNSIKKNIRIGIIGDIMDLGGKSFQISEKLKNFFSDCDYLIGNFEATLTHEPKQWMMDQIHDEQVLESLAKLFPPDKTFLSVANNHAGDFNEDTFLASCCTVENAGFNIFGLKDKIYLDITPKLRIFGASKWSNKPTYAIAKLGTNDSFNLNLEGFNMLYPHWGWELELYPRLDTINEAQQYSKTFDAIIGHHSHTPQPITTQEINGVKKPFAYSLGDFCFGKPFKMFFYGEILKMDIGPISNPSNQAQTNWVVGELVWSFVKSSIRNSTEVFIDLADTIPFFKDIK